MLTYYILWNKVFKITRCSAKTTTQKRRERSDVTSSTCLTQKTCRCSCPFFALHDYLDSSNLKSEFGIRVLRSQGLGGFRPFKKMSLTHGFFLTKLIALIIFYRFLKTLIFMVLVYLGFLPIHGNTSVFYSVVRSSGAIPYGREPKPRLAHSFIAVW